MKNAIASVIVVALAVGCDSESNEVKLEDFGQKSADTVCDKVYQCCSLTDTELMAHMGYSGGRAACGNKNKDQMGFWAAVIAKEQDKGRLAYDPKLAHRCLQAFTAASCDGHKRNVTLEGCDTFITPKTPAGAPCNASESCMGGSCIDGSADKEGVCQAFATENTSCAERTCAKGLRCDGNKMCVPQRPNGEACHTNSECQSQGCNGRNADAGTPGTCGLKGGADTTCFVTNGCSYGSRPGGGELPLVVLFALAVVRIFVGKFRPKR
jgi:hypothetical protein